MTLFAASRPHARQRRRGSHLPLFAITTTIGGLAVALVAYLLWPTWGTVGGGEPDRLPVSIGGTLFNVPPMAVRMKIQRHSGPQERIDLDFTFPALDVPSEPKRVSREGVAETAHPIDRIFLSIAAHHDALAPEARIATIYPRYLESGSTPFEGGLTMRSFRESTPYGGEDLFQAASPAFTARCTRDGATPGMCLSERRIEGADLTFRFPRSWFAQWREVASAMDRLTIRLRGTK